MMNGVKITFDEMLEAYENNVTEPLWYKIRLHMLVLLLCSYGPSVEELVVNKRVVRVEKMVRVQWKRN